MDEFITSEEFYTISSKLKESIVEFYDKNVMLNDICKQIDINFNLDSGQTLHSFFYLAGIKDIPIFFDSRLIGSKMMNLMRNSVLQNVAGNSKIRILYMFPVENSAVIISLDKKDTLPYEIVPSELECDLENGDYIEIQDNMSLTYTELVYLFFENFSSQTVFQWPLFSIKLLIISNSVLLLFVLVKTRADKERPSSILISIIKNNSEL